MKSGLFINDSKRSFIGVVVYDNDRTLCLVYTGKTTLADTLVASNGIISQRMAGKVRNLHTAKLDIPHCPCHTASNILVSAS